MKKVDSSGYDTDKADLKHYFDTYEEIFAPLADREVKLFEMGVNRGGSLLIWRDYFHKGTIVGLDINPWPLDDETGRICFYQGRQQDTDLLDRIARENAPEGFDVIIDDCSHIGELSRISFWHLFVNHLKPGGIYAIEDWGTGYWPSFPDGKRYSPSVRPSRPYRAASHVVTLINRLLKGKRAEKYTTLLFRLACHKRRFPSHDYGMVGFVKQLVDEMAMADITWPGLGAGPFRPSLFGRILISYGQVIIFKAKGAVPGPRFSA